MKRRRVLGSLVLLGAIVALGLYLAAWKRAELKQSADAAKSHPEPMEAVTVAKAGERDNQRTTVAIGTVMALQSITLQNELAGTVRMANLSPGQIVEAGTVLIALDVAVEEAELEALQAQADLATTMLGRMERARDMKGVSDTDVDRAKSERDVLFANVARAEAVIARKTITAPFRAKIGLSDVHIGQYLNAGSQITTLQGIDNAANVDFTITQNVAALLKEGDRVVVSRGRGDDTSIDAVIVAIDSRIDALTRNAMARARIDGPAAQVLPPGAAVRVRVPVSASRRVVVVPANALRKGPGGDHVFVIETAPNDKPRAHQRTVTSGALLGDEVVIESGLKVGELVAASGSFKLREGVLVGFADPSAPAAH
ncbi:MAG: efflux RND transporter periplasmic adaptor subunit [Planctomycetota bacterium]|nr:efflux RND transporter periplasmic adaptor subunit [Planctomycetota bacterium]